MRLAVIPETLHRGSDCSRLKLDPLPFSALDLDPEADMVSSHHTEGGDEGLFPEIEKKMDVSFLLQI